jgi:hypothetical protein
MGVLSGEHCGQFMNVEVQLLDQLVKYLSRVFFLFIATMLMAGSYLLLALALTKVDYILYIGVILIGYAFGGVWSMNVSH